MNRSLGAIIGYNRIRLAGIVLGALALGLVVKKVAFADSAQLPGFFVYQGRLTKPDGTAVSDTTYNLRFTIYLDAGGKVEVCDSSHLQVPVKGGVFRVAIGSGGGTGSGTCNSKDLQNEFATRSDLWMKIEVAPGGTTQYEALTPFVQIGANPRSHYAQRAGTAEVAKSASGELKTQVDQLVPPGSVMAYTGTTDPPGWLICNGRSFPTTQYQALYNVIGTSHGGGGGNFSIPDYAGRFLRGADWNKKLDPDALTRGPMAPGGTPGLSIGSVQDWGTGFPKSGWSVSEAPNHYHLYWEKQGGGASGYMSPGGGNGSPMGHPGYTDPAGAHSHGVSGGDSETRPANAYVNYIIKY